jgi:predicted transcriptional regulator
MDTLQSIWDSMNETITMMGTLARIPTLCIACILSFDYIISKANEKCKPLLEAYDKKKKSQISVLRQDSKISSAEQTKLQFVSTKKVYDQDLRRLEQTFSELNEPMLAIDQIHRDIMEEMNQRINEAHARLDTLNQILDEKFRRLDASLEIHRT